MLRFITIIIILFSMNIAYAQNSSNSQINTRDSTAADVYAACKRYFDHTFNTRESIARKATCNGYFFGIGSTLLMLQNSNIPLPFCLPEDVSTEDIIQNFIDWAKEKPHKLSKFSTKGVIASIENSYACDNKYRTLSSLSNQ